MRCTTRCGSTTTCSSRCCTWQAKEVVDGRLKRRWDTAQTPYQRLRASGMLAPEEEARLAAHYRDTNPRQLREAIYHAVARLWQQPDLLPRKETATSGNIPK